MGCGPLAGLRFVLMSSCSALDIRVGSADAPAWGWGVPAPLLGLARTHQGMEMPGIWLKGAYQRAEMLGSTASMLKGFSGP